MPTPHLQVELDIHDPLPGMSDLKLTPIDTAISDKLASALSEAIAMADQFDSEPGDGELDEKTTLKIPVRLNFFHIYLNREVDLAGELRVRVTHAQPDAPAAAVAIPVEPVVEAPATDVPVEAHTQPATADSAPAAQEEAGQAVAEATPDEPVPSDPAPETAEAPPVQVPNGDPEAA